MIAMYAGALGDNAVERYAMFLTSLELSADINERKLALMRAREHGLDMERVAIVAAERTIERAFSVCFSHSCDIDLAMTFMRRPFLMHGVLYLRLVG